MTECTTADCGAPSGDLYLCAACIRDLDGRLKQGLALIPEMDVTIARLDNVRVGNVEGGNGSKAAGSAAPMDITALEIKMTLEEDTRYTANQYAADPWSASETPRVIENIRKAELLISGPEDDAPTQSKIQADRKALAQHFPDPMPPTECATWLRENAGIKIAARNINDWYHRGRIRKQEGSTPKRPLYSPKEVLIAHMARQHE